MRKRVYSVVTTTPDRHVDVLWDVYERYTHVLSEPIDASDDHSPEL